jgi:hypothetical protein
MGDGLNLIGICDCKSCLFYQMQQVVNLGFIIFSFDVDSLYCLFCKKKLIINQHYFIFKNWFFFLFNFYKVISKF